MALDTLLDVWDLAAALLGFIVLALAAETGVVDLYYIGVPLLSAGGVGLYMRVRPWYCKMCGQFLGRGQKPNRCNRCGSNRVTNRDPTSKDSPR